MKPDYDIVSRVYAAKEDAKAADELVLEYLPFIKSETAKFLKRFPVEGQDDELGIAMFAFYEAAMAYSREKGAFLKLAAVAVRNRLIDYQRREQRHAKNLSLDQTVGGDGESRTVMEQLDTGHDEIAHCQMRKAAREEIEDFVCQLSEFDLKLTDIADNCPKQERTMAACRRVLAYARENPLYLEQLVSTRKLPVSPLSEGSGVDKKTLERHRKYLVALLLAFTNGFEIIRGHLCRMTPKKGGVN